MPALNASEGDGGLTKTFQWVTVGLFAFQFVSALVKTRHALAEGTRILHLGTAIGLALSAHLGVVFRHAVVLRDRLLRRMLPGRR